MRGNITHEGSPVPSKVNVPVLSEEESVITEGSFRIRLRVPILDLTGYRNLTVMVDPLDSRYERITMRRRVYSVGWVGLIAGGALVLLILAPLFRREHVFDSIKAHRGDIRVVRKPRSEDMKFRDPLARLYFSAVRMIERRLGIRMRPSHTLREYAARVRVGLGVLSFFFDKMTLIYEAYLYGGIRRGTSALRDYYKVLRRALGR